MISVALVFASLTHAQQDETVGMAVNMMYPRCVRKACARPLVSCNRDGGPCQQRLRCAMGRGGEGGDIGECYKAVTWQTLSDDEVKIFDCAKREDCVHGDYDEEGAENPSSFIERVDNEMQSRQLVNDYAIAGARGEASEAEGHGAVKEEMAAALRDVLALHSGDNLTATHTAMLVLAKHEATIQAVQQLLAKSSKLLQNAEEGKLEEGETQDDQNKKLLETLGALNAAMQTVSDHANDLGVQQKGFAAASKRAETRPAMTPQQAVADVLPVSGGQLRKSA